MADLDEKERPPETAEGESQDAFDELYGLDDETVDLDSL